MEPKPEYLEQFHTLPPTGETMLLLQSPDIHTALLSLTGAPEVPSWEVVYVTPDNEVRSFHLGVTAITQDETEESRLLVHGVLLGTDTPILIAFGRTHVDHNTLFETVTILDLESTN